MGLKAKIIACAAAALLAPACAQAEIFNGSFESNLDDWTANDDLVFIPGEFHHLNADDVADFSYAPVDGYFFAHLIAGEAETPTLVTQTFTTGGGTFSGFAAFLGRDSLFTVDDQTFGGDYGFVRIFATGSGITMYSMSLFSAGIDPAGGYGYQVGDYGYTPWTGFSVALAAGEYTIEAGVVNGGDGFNESHLLIDNFRVAVPEPQTWALMLSGFFGMGAMLRRQRRLQPVRIRRD